MLRIRNARVIAEPPKSMKSGDLLAPGDDLPARRHIDPLQVGLGAHGWRIGEILKAIEHPHPQPEIRTALKAQRGLVLLQELLHRLVDRPFGLRAQGKTVQCKLAEAASLELGGRRRGHQTHGREQQRQKHKPTTGLCPVLPLVAP